MSFSLDCAHNREPLISSDVLSWARKDKRSRAANEIYKWSLVLLLEVDYNWGVVFSTSALISATKMPLVLFLEGVVPVRQLTVSVEAWCVVSRLDVTHPRACYSFLICYVKVMLSLCFSSFPFLSLFLHVLMWRRCHREDEKTECWCWQGRRSPITGKELFFPPLINEMWFTLKFGWSFRK